MRRSGADAGGRILSAGVRRRSAGKRDGRLGLSASGAVVRLKANLTTARHQKWLEWISGASSLRNRFLDEEGYDPFDFNETASVSLLASAAVHIGGLALAESISTKRKQEDYRKKGHGRDDLYILLGDQGWTFEFKQIFRPITSQLKGQFDAACRCARQTDTLDG